MQEGKQCKKGGIHQKDSKSFIRKVLFENKEDLDEQKATRGLKS